jgi:hypothetical protein
VESSAPPPTTTLQCPITLPGAGFRAPEPYPTDYPHEGLAWYGTDALWTALAVEGDHGPRKTVLWSAAFPGGAVEERPEVWVTWRRLDVDPPVELDNGGEATNAATAEEGWFMIAGIDPDEPGCWEVEATYKGATLSYVYEVP